MNHRTNALSQRYGINGHRVILYAGTFENYQGLELLVEASRELVRQRRNVRFICAGGSECQVDRVRRVARHRGVAEYFIFPGTLEQAEVESLFGIASIVISPRTAGTNTPLKIYSYLRSGVPIIATRIESHTQVLTDNVAVLVEPSPESLSSGLVRLLDDFELSRRLVENARRLAETTYTPDSYQQKIAEVLSFLAANSRRPA